MAPRLPVPQPVLDAFGSTINLGETVAYAHQWKGYILGKVVDFRMRGVEVHVEIEPTQAAMGTLEYKNPTVLVSHRYVLTARSIQQNAKQP